MTRYGITLSSFTETLLELGPFLQEVTDIGYTDIWSYENSVLDAFTPLAFASVHAPTARLGTAIAHAYTRGPAILAMSIAGLCQAAPGRVVVGIGPSTKVIVENWNNIPYEKPYSRVRDTVTFLRAALAGEKVDEEYETFAVKRFRLAAKIEQPPPIVIGGSQPKMLSLAGSHADGAIINNVTADDAVKVAAHVRKDNPDAEVICSVYVQPNEDADTDKVRSMWKANLAAYVNSPGYAAAQEWLGHGDELRESWAKWKDGDREGAAAAIPDDYIDALVAHGPIEEVREKIQRYVDAGVDTIMFEMVPGVGDATEVFRGLAPK